MFSTPTTTTNNNDSEFYQFPVMDQVEAPTVIRSYQFPVVMDQIETLLTRCYNCQSSYVTLHEVLELDEMVVFWILTELFGVLQRINESGNGSVREAIAHAALQLTQEVMTAYVS